VVEAPGTATEARVVAARALLAAAGELSFPRFAGGPGEKQAAALVARRLRDAGLTVRLEGFRASRVALGRLRLLLQGAVAVAAAVFAALAAVGAPGAWLLGAATLGGAALSGRWRRGIEPAFVAEPAIDSVNVTARRPGRVSGAGEAAPARHARTVVLLAHLDSKSSRYATFWTASAAIAMIAWLVVATTASASSAASGGVLPPAVAAIGVVVAAGLLLVSWNPPGDESPGAMDNASGLAVLLDLAATLPRDPRLDGLDLVFLATGAEELGLVGATRWIAAHGPELDRARTVFVNVDSVGVGNVLLAVDVRGTLPDGRSWARALRVAADRAAVRVRRLPFLPGVGVDSMPIGARGFATVSILGDVLGAAARRIHSRRDGIEHLSGEGLHAAARLVEELVVEMARGGTAA
jgi:hypothetical protein